AFVKHPRMHRRGHCGKTVELESSFSRFLSQTEVVCHGARDVLGQIAAQRFEYLRDRFKSMNPDPGNRSGHMQCKQPNVCAHIEDRVPLANRDAVTLISALRDDLTIEDSGFEKAGSPNLEWTGKGY